MGKMFTLFVSRDSLLRSLMTGRCFPFSFEDLKEKGLDTVFASLAEKSKEEDFGELEVIVLHNPGAETVRQIRSVFDGILAVAYDKNMAKKENLSSWLEEGADLVFWICPFPSQSGPTIQRFIGERRREVSKEARRASIRASLRPS